MSRSTSALRRSSSTSSCHFDAPPPSAAARSISLSASSIAAPLSRSKVATELEATFASDKAATSISGPRAAALSFELPSINRSARACRWSSNTILCHAVAPPPSGVARSRSLNASSMAERWSISIVATAALLGSDNATNSISGVCAANLSFSFLSMRACTKAEHGWCCTRMCHGVHSRGGNKAEMTKRHPHALGPSRSVLVVIVREFCFSWSTGWPFLPGKGASGPRPWKDLLKPSASMVTVLALSKVCVCSSNFTEIRVAPGKSTLVDTSILASSGWELSRTRAPAIRDARSKLQLPTASAEIDAHLVASSNAEATASVQTAPISSKRSAMVDVVGFAAAISISGLSAASLSRACPPISRSVSDSRSSPKAISRHHVDAAATFA